MDFAEELAAAAYQSLGYYVIGGKRIGQRELDILGVKLGAGDKVLDRIHVEVQVSVRPVGVIRPRGDLRSTGASPDVGADRYIDRKFFDPAIRKMAQGLLGSSRYRRVFVHGKLNSKSQLHRFRLKKIECVPIGQLVAQALENNPVSNLLRMAGVAELLRIKEA